jgi:hypothetical protein
LTCCRTVLGEGGHVEEGVGGRGMGLVVVMLSSLMTQARMLLVAHEARVLFGWIVLWILGRMSGRLRLVLLGGGGHAGVGIGI